MELEFVRIFCHFFEKKWRKKLPTGRFLAHIAGSTIQSTMFALTKRIIFCLNKQKRPTKWVMFLAENLKAPLSASIAFDRSNANRRSSTPYNDRKR